MNNPDPHGDRPRLIARQPMRVGYPPGWDTWDGRNEGHVLANFEMPPIAGTRKKVARFGARYRAANLFIEARFQNPGMNGATAQGYSDLLRFMLTFSAAETLLDLLGIEATASGTLYTDDERQQVARALRRRDPEARIFTAVHADLMPGRRVQREVGQYLAGDDASPYILAQGLRHSFAHGQLTPNVSRVEPADVSGVVEVVSAALKLLMDREFGGRMERFTERFPPPPVQPPDDDAPF